MKSMDPQAQLTHCRDAYRTGDYALATLLLLEYYRWRLTGGKPPAFGDKWAAELSDDILDRIENWGNIARTLETAS